MEKGQFNYHKVYGEEVENVTFDYGVDRDEELDMDMIYVKINDHKFYSCDLEGLVEAAKEILNQLTSKDVKHKADEFV